MDDLRETIARAIRQTREFRAGAAFGIPAEAYGQATDGMADAVIAALGLTEELGSRSHGPSPMDCGVTPGPDILGRHNHRRWVTEWEEVDE